MAAAPNKPVKPKNYDERIYRKGHPPHQMRNALILIALVVIGSYLAVTKSLPFGSDYEVKATFDNAANVRQGSPVRIAGVNVGEVKGVRSVGDAAEVTFTVSEDGRPVHEDAQVEIRPRIFLEGNFFIDVEPGSPSAPEMPDDGTIPITQTSTAVQLDQILTSLQAPERENLQKLLQGYGQALNYRPTAADDKGQDPDVQGETAGEATNDAFVYGATAARDSAIVNEALLGTEPGDLRNLIASNVKVFDALNAREAQLKDFITNLNTTAGAFAAESENLSESVRLLAPDARERDADPPQHERDLPLPAGVRAGPATGSPRAPGDDRGVTSVPEADAEAPAARRAWPPRLPAAPYRRAGGAGRCGGGRPVQPDRAAQPLRVQRPDPDGGHPDHRRLRRREHDPQLQGVRLRGHGALR